MIGLATLAWFGLEPWHLLLLGIVALLLYGKRLPEVGRSLGRGIAEFKKGLHDVQDELSKEESEPEPPKPKLRAPERGGELPADQKPGAEESKEQQDAGEQARDQ
jgi:sec-independent protein translocase protein TatA